MNGNVSCCYATLDAKHLVWPGGKPVARVPRKESLKKHQSYKGG